MRKITIALLGCVAVLFFSFVLFVNLNSAFVFYSAPLLKRVMKKNDNSVMELYYNDHKELVFGKMEMSVTKADNGFERGIFQFDLRARYKLIYKRQMRDVIFVLYNETAYPGFYGPYGYLHKIIEDLDVNKPNEKVIQFRKTAELEMALKKVILSAASEVDESNFINIFTQLIRIE